MGREFHFVGTGDTGCGLSRFPVVGDSADLRFHLLLDFSTKRMASAVSVIVSYLPDALINAANFSVVICSASARILDRTARSNSPVNITSSL